MLGTKNAGANLALDKVRLRDAEKLLQPVYGTDTESTYHTVALGPSLKAAVRIRPGTYSTSIRVEGPAVEVASSYLEEVGLTPKDGIGGRMASLHVEPGSKVSALKVVGSVLLALGSYWTEIEHDLSLVVGAGT